MGGFAWVTLATNDSYSLGALVLAHSLKQAGTTQQLAVLITPGVTNAMREKLQTVFNVVQEVNILDSRDEANLRLLKRPELGVTFTKLHCWRLTQYEKCVFLDADTLVLQNCDELFEREELSAAPDVGWPDCFNSGVFVYRPSNDTFDKLIQFALEKGSFDGGDQGLLNLYFSDWAHKDISKHLPFIYNMCSTACYSYLPAFKQYGSNAKIIHFIGATKPWLQYFNTETRKVQPSGDSVHLQEVLQRWWDIFCSLIHPQLSPSMAGLAGAFAKLTLGVARTPEQETFESVLRKQAWEVGNIDYLGKDSFENIWNKISETLAAVPVESQPEAETETSKETPKEMPEVALKTETKVPLETPKCDVVAQETSNVEIPAEPAVTETIVSPPIQTSQPLKQDEHPTAEASIVTEVSAASLPSPISEISSPLETKEIIAKEIKTAEILEQEPVSKACPVPIKKLEPESSQPLTDTQSVLEACPLHAKPSETDLPESPQSLPQIPKTDEQCVLGVQSTPKSEKPLSTMIAEQQPEVSSIVQSLPEAPKDLAGETQSSDIKTSAEGRSESQSTPDECKKSESAAAEGTVVEAIQSEKLLTEAKVVLKTEQILECRKPEKETEEPKPSSLPVSQLSLDSQTIQTATESTTAEPIPQPKVTEPTPPRTPSTPPVAPLPQLENVKQALVIESNVPDTPPPSSSQDVSPTPPPRKEGKSKKSGAKPKK